MPTIHLIHGFIGFGKTTIAKRLEKEFPAIRFTHDELMIQTYGRNPEDFSQERFDIIDKIIKEKTIEEIKKGNNIILDYGFWEKDTRKKYYDWAKKITPDVLFHAVQCDISLAKKRALERTKKHSEEFYIDEDIFNDRLKRFEPMTQEEGFPVVFYRTDDK